MGYSGGKIQDFFGPDAKMATRRAARAVVELASDDLRHRAAELTPRRTGRTADAWRALPVVREGERIVGGTENPSHKALWLEHGTQPHDLKPKRAEALATPEGPRAGAHHPGTPALHPLARAAEEIDATIATRAEPILQRWAREVEDSANQRSR